MKTASTLLWLTLALLPAAQEVGSDEPVRLIWADYDGDGLDDALTLSSEEAVRLLRNAGDGTLADVTEVVGLAGVRGTCALWEDYDLDGTPDLFVGASHGPSRLFKGDGSTFEDVTAAAGLVHDGPALSGGWLDYDRDGLPDLCVHTASSTQLYRNLGADLFERVPLAPSAPDGFAHPMGVAKGAGEVRATLPTAEAAPTAGGPSHAAPSLSGSKTASVPPVNVKLPNSGVMTGLPFCAPGILDQATGACMQASSDPTLGQLYPLSSDLFVEPGSGDVGIGTTTPTSKLEVAGTVKVGANLELTNPNSRIVFPHSGAPGAPMVYMYPDNATGLERTVISLNPSKPTTGLKFRPVDRTFYFSQLQGSFAALSIDLVNQRVGIGTSVPQSDLHLSAPGSVEVLLEADINNGTGQEGDQPSIRFSQDGGLAQARIGFQDSENHLAFRNLYSGGGMRFDLHTSSTQDWEFRRRASTGLDVEARLTQSGALQLDGSVSSPAADLAEFYPVAAGVEPGDVVAFSGDGQSLDLARPGDGRPLAGVISSRPAFVMGLSYTDEHQPGVLPAETLADEGSGDTGPHAVDRDVLHEIQVNGRAPLALAGRVPVKVSAESGAIRPGDLLALSSIPGRAMKATGAGATIGTALEAWASGEGVILVFVRTGGSTAAERELALLRGEFTVLRAQLARMADALATLGLPVSTD